ncbi:MAG TPA: class I SAM-dependent methyltransferase, partial [Candidatus Limnocylindrales bacterium]|nr:class I SAM-dependent methyltransferase [Candidatus Limnocylindrales bacterium]
DRLEPRARVDLVRDLVVASDLRRHRHAPDFVVGPGPASFTLARHVRPHPGGRLLDLGSGSGIQGLLLAGPGDDVVAIDISPRAVAFTRLNADLNGRRRIRPVLGDFLAEAPDRALDGRFQTVVANPPFVLAPSHDLLYRDRPLPGDEVGARTVERVARALAPGGRGYVLCNWIDRGGEWSAPVRTWLRGSGVDVSIARLAALTPAAYAATWTRDVEPDNRATAAERWRTLLVAEGIGLIHVGVIAVSRPRLPRLRTRFVARDMAASPSPG